jgi:Cryptococcal mannosyltransferase 1
MKNIFFIVVLCLLVFLLFRYYWKLQIMYNSSILSLYTPETFEIDESLREKHDDLIDTGYAYAKLNTIIIATMLRDVEDRLPQIEKKVEALGEMFLDYRVLIVENDSKDHTRKYLLSWANRNPKIIVLGCGINERVCDLKLPKTLEHSPDRKRIEKMVYLRNIYLSYTKEHFDDWTYMAIWDLDVIGATYMDGVANTMGWYCHDLNKEIDVICANGIYRFGFMTWFYDTYAFQEEGDNYKSSDQNMHNIKKGLGTQYTRGHDLIDVKSCFSGFSIYRMECVLDPKVFYDMSGPDNTECEHVQLHKKIKGKKMMNPSMINFILLND